MAEGKNRLQPWTLNLWSWVQEAGGYRWELIPLTYPDMFKHLHGRKGLEGTDETLWVTEPGNNIWDPWEERLSPPFQELMSNRKGKKSVGTLLPQVSFPAVKSRLSPCPLIS
jgi:hypothetical protein